MRAVRFDEYGGGGVLGGREGAGSGGGPGGGAEGGEGRGGGKPAEITPGDIATGEGLLNERGPASFPSGEGTDFAGAVQTVGDGATAFAAGDEVLGWTEERASHAELVVVPADQLTAKPASVSWEVAGSLFVVAMVAYVSVVDGTP